MWNVMDANSCAKAETTRCTSTGEKEKCLLSLAIEKLTRTCQTRFAKISEYQSPNQSLHLTAKGGG
ncbi:MAG: hypothetical protein DDT26_01227 [Dehalococcoidia bacterium]|nr:hypothetical protein [Chloroflexota bacterium]